MVAVPLLGCGSPWECLKVYQHYQRCLTYLVRTVTALQCCGSPWECLKVYVYHLLSTLLTLKNCRLILFGLVPGLPRPVLPQRPRLQAQMRLQVQEEDPVPAPGKMEGQSSLIAKEIIMQ